MPPADAAVKRVDRESDRSTPVIENCEPNFRKGSKAEIQTKDRGGIYLPLRRRKLAHELEASAAKGAQSQAMLERVEAVAAACARPRTVRGDSGVKRLIRLGHRPLGDAED